LSSAGSAAPRTSSNATWPTPRCGRARSGFVATSRDRIFDAFHTTKPSGLGLGLNISRSIIEAHGGRLWCAPNEGGGETFSFVLPA
jgi:C4-dicarboxylate-specific signal transduction histidine kinase